MYSINLSADNLSELKNKLSRAVEELSGTIVHLHHVTLDSLEQNGESQAPEAAPDADIQTIGINVYSSSRQDFALGARLYGSAASARANSTPRNYIGSLEFKFDRVNDRVVPGATSAASNFVTAPRYWALIDDDGDLELGRNSFTTVSQLRETYDGAIGAVICVRRTEGGQYVVTNG